MLNEVFKDQDHVFVEYSSGPLAYQARLASAHVLGHVLKALRCQLIMALCVMSIPGAYAYDQLAHYGLV